MKLYPQRIKSEIEYLNNSIKRNNENIEILQSESLIKDNSYEEQARKNLIIYYKQYNIRFRIMLEKVKRQIF